MAHKLTISGYRGIVGETFTKEIVEEYTKAFLQFLKQRGGSSILVTQDGRESGLPFLNQVIQLASKAGFTIWNAGIIPTPTALLYIREHAIDGGILVTASHNPIQYNGLKFIRHDGTFPNYEEVEEIKSLCKTTGISSENLGEIKDIHKEAMDYHIKKILEHIDTKPIKESSLRVLLDPVNAAGSEITPLLFEALGISSEKIHGIQSGKFERLPEPIPKNIGELSKIVKEKGFDLGFAQDPDADRLTLVDENGICINEEMTLALCVESILRKFPGDTVINFSTSQMVQDITKKYGGTCYRSRVGEANAMTKIKEVGAIIGGEGCGGIIYPIINLTRDSLVGITLILSLIAETKKTLSQLVSELPVYAMKKEEHTLVKTFDELKPLFLNEFKDMVLSTEDGLWFEKDHAWLHIRTSNTEPILRLIGEAKTPKELATLFARAHTCLFL